MPQFLEIERILLLAYCILLGFKFNAVVKFSYLAFSPNWIYWKTSDTRLTELLRASRSLSNWRTELEFQLRRRTTHLISFVGTRVFGWNSSPFQAFQICKHRTRRILVMQFSRRTRSSTSMQKRFCSFFVVGLYWILKFLFVWWFRSFVHSLHRLHLK